MTAAESRTRLLLALRRARVAMQECVRVLEASRDTGDLGPAQLGAARGHAFVAATTLEFALEDVR